MTHTALQSKRASRFLANDQVDLTSVLDQSLIETQRKESPDHEADYLVTRHR
jgi:hypothetical protein